MKESQYSDEQIARILRETERDPITEETKRQGAGEAAIYSRRKRFGGINNDDVMRPKVPKLRMPTRRNWWRNAISNSKR